MATSGKQPSGKQPQRKRSRNYTTSETELFLELAGKNKKIIEGRFSMTVSAEKKKKLWTDIAREVNGVNGQNNRTPKDLKKKYQNLLNIAKSKERKNNVTSRKTGGGPSEELPLSTVEQMALDNVSSVHVEGIDGGFDANRSILVGVDNEIGSTLSSILTIIALSPDREEVSQLNGQDSTPAVELIPTKDTGSAAPVTQAVEPTPTQAAEPGPFNTGRTACSTGHAWTNKK